MVKIGLPSFVAAGLQIINLGLTQLSSQTFPEAGF
jgi:hypothetical protein